MVSRGCKMTMFCQGSLEVVKVVIWVCYHHVVHDRFSTTRVNEQIPCTNIQNKERNVKKDARDLVSLHI